MWLPTLRVGEAQVEDKDLALSVPCHFLTDEDFRSEEFQNMEDFYEYCRGKVEEGIGILAKINDALRRYLIGMELGKEDHSLLFDSHRVGNKPPSVQESSALFTNQLTNDSTSCDQFLPLLEEHLLIENLKKELSNCKAIIESQRLEISAFESRLNSVGGLHADLDFS